jgi:hypothetical protein
MSTKKSPNTNVLAKEGRDVDVLRGTVVDAASVCISLWISYLATNSIPFGEKLSNSIQRAWVAKSKPSDFRLANDILRARLTNGGRQEK